MDKKYSVFVSSTFEDLKEERQLVINSLLQMDCFPVGMEYFNASDESQWNVIKQLIDDCDYYVLIIAGRYGSIDPKTGKSYTQLEYEYARDHGVPTIAFIHEHPENIESGKVDFENKSELDAFRAEVQKTMVKYWNTSGDLSASVVTSLLSMIKTKPRIGWMRANEKSSNEQNKEMLRLIEENDNLRNQIKTIEESAPIGTDNLAQGEDRVTIEFVYVSNGYDRTGSCTFTWNEVCQTVLPHLTQDCMESQMKHSIEQQIEAIYSKYHRVNLKDQSFQVIKVQLMALGLITPSPKPKSGHDYMGVWTLTKYGRLTMVRLTAVQKS